MCSKRDVVIFVAGAEAFHTLSHLVLNFSNTLPINAFGMTWTQHLNLYAIAINIIITVALLWWASKLKK